jgi:hypothetical protein
MYLTGIYRIFHLTATENIFFSLICGLVSKIDSILGHKASLNKYKTTEITSCILSAYSRIKLDINIEKLQKIFKRKYTKKFTGSLKK